MQQSSSVVYNKGNTFRQVSVKNETILICSSFHFFSQCSRITWYSVTMLISETIFQYHVGIV